jgi:hypothetical protein
MYKIEDRVKITSENDNENYDSFREKILIVENIATNEEAHPGYDNSMEGMQLMDFRTEDGEEVPFSLYEYEVELI